MPDASEIFSRCCSKAVNSRIAGRIAGAFRDAGQEHIADETVEDDGEGRLHTVRETDPFEDTPRTVLQIREPSPSYVDRCATDVAGACADTVVGALPAAPGLPRGTGAPISRPSMRSTSVTRITPSQSRATRSAPS